MQNCAELKHAIVMWDELQLCYVDREPGCADVETRVWSDETMRAVL